jgi:ABC-type branched-subunit amino acid transport system ATPase component
MTLVMSVCDYIYVMDFGEPIFQGTAQEVGASEVVRAAYLGDDAVEAAVPDGVGPTP